MTELEARRYKALEAEIFLLDCQLWSLEVDDVQQRATALYELDEFLDPGELRKISKAANDN